MAAGHRISQVQVRGSVDGQLVFSAVGATATPRPDGLHGQFQPMPEVGPPDDGRGLFAGFDIGDNAGHHERFVMRIARAGRRRAAGHLPLWARFTEPLAFTPATISFLADMVPMSIARAAGQMGAGSSLDNTLRFGPVPAPDLDWVLLDLHGQLPPTATATGHSRCGRRTDARRHRQPDGDHEPPLRAASLSVEAVRAGSDVTLSTSARWAKFLH